MVKSLFDNRSKDWAIIVDKLHISADDSRYELFKQIHFLLVFSQHKSIENQLGNEFILSEMRKLGLESLISALNGLDNAMIFTLRSTEDALLNLLLSHSGISSDASRFVDKKKLLKDAQYYPLVNKLHNNYKIISNVFHGDSESDQTIQFVFESDRQVTTESLELAIDGFSIINELLFDLSKSVLHVWVNSDIKDYLSLIFSKSRINNIIKNK
ncbi:hypothetical protein [Weissella confusa]|uniref:hypothetical protein n=1 Tax=Weissella confusa TaxID=1583 RepID=UPI0021A52A13|nr:hypothetical protein [Weissella confusa]MCT2911068.1 hypothetical protein [Weissella confusa]